MLKEGQPYLNMKMRIYKRYGKNTIDARYDFKKAYPEKTLLKIKVDKNYKPPLSLTKKGRRVKKRYLIRAKDKE